LFSLKQRLIRDQATHWIWPVRFPNVTN